MVAPTGRQDRGAVRGECEPYKGPRGAANFESLIRLNVLSLTLRHRATGMIRGHSGVPVDF